MTEKRRIALNLVATYGRSLYALVIGLCCGRWALQALGRDDYGLVGLIGGLTGFVTFLNSLLASAVGRFYAVNVGAARKKGNEKNQRPCKLCPGIQPVQSRFYLIILSDGNIAYHFVTPKLP